MIFFLTVACLLGTLYATSQPYQNSSVPNPYIYTYLCKMVNLGNATANFTVSPPTLNIYAVTTAIVGYQPQQTSSPCVGCPEYWLVQPSPTNITVAFTQYVGCDGAAVLSLGLLFTTEASRQFITLQTTKIVKCKLEANIVRSLSAGTGIRSETTMRSFPSSPLDATHNVKVLPFIRSFMFERPSSSLALSVQLVQVNQSAYILNYTAQDGCLVKYAGTNIIIVDLSIATMSRSVDWRVGYLVIGTGLQPASVGLSILSNPSVLLGLTMFQLLPNESVKISALAFPATVDAVPTIANLTVIQAQPCSCPYAYPYMMIEQMMCYNACPAAYQIDTKLNFCYKCHVDCLTCVGPLPENCSSCSSLKTLTSGRCLCTAPMGNSYTGQCIACNASCDGCYGTADNCLKCKGYRVVVYGKCECPPGSIDDGLGDGDCTPCWQLFPGCSICSSSACTACSDTFYLYNGSCRCMNNYVPTLNPNFCQSCATAFPGCVSCTDSGKCLQCGSNLILSYGKCLCKNSSNYIQTDSVGWWSCVACTYPCVTCMAADWCLTCPINYRLSNSSQCLPICGDRVIIGDQCQDGNALNGDGCSSECTVQEGYVCLVSGQTHLSVCLDGSVSIDYVLVSQQKVGFSNELTLTIRPLQPIEKGTQLFINQSIGTPQKTYTYDGNSTQVSIPYNSSLQFTTVVLSIAAAAGKGSSMMLPASVVQVFVDPDNLSANWFSEGVYQQAKVIRVVVLVISALALLVMVLNTAFNNSTNIDGLAVLQVIYLCILGTRQSSPVTIEMGRSLYPAIGYNQLFANIPISWGNSTRNSKLLNELGVSVLFVGGVNYMLLLQLMLTTLELFVYLLAQRKQGRGKNGLIKATNFFRQSAIMLRTFNLTQVFCSLGLSLAYLRSVPTFDGAVNLAGSLLAIGILAACYKLPTIDRSVYSQDKPLSLFADAEGERVHRLAVMFVRAGSGLAAGLFHYTGYGLVPVVALQLVLLGGFTNVIADRWQRVKAVIVQIIAVAATISTMAVSSVSNGSPETLELTCWVLLAGAFLCITIDIICLVREFHQRRTNRNQNLRTQ